MTPLVRRGDINSAGGVLTAGHRNVICNGRPTGLQGGGVTPHPCCPQKGCSIHCSAKAAYPGSRLVTINGIKALRVGRDRDTCGHPRATGSPNTVLR